jgi:hypothetical protein
VSGVPVDLHCPLRGPERRLQRGQGRAELLRGAPIHNLLGPEEDAVRPVAELLGLVGESRGLGADHDPVFAERHRGITGIEFDGRVPHEPDGHDFGGRIHLGGDPLRKADKDQDFAHVNELDVLHPADRYARDPDRGAGLEIAGVAELHLPEILGPTSN